MRAKAWLRSAFVAGLTSAGAFVLGSSADAAPDAGAAPASQVTPPALDDVEHMCALLTGCDKLPLPAGLVPRDFVGCSKALYEELTSPSAVTFSLTLKECGLRSSSCGELRTCALRGAKPDVCAGRGKGGTPVDMCDADGRAITCINERIAGVRDCPRGGEQCAVRDGKAQCTLGSCEKDGPATCSASGTRILECKKGKLVSLDCAAFGLRCANSANGPQCASQTTACSKEKSSRCEGGTAIGCFHGHEVRVDCGSAGLACAGGGTPVGSCQTVNLGSKGGSCDPNAPAKCDGATLKWCAWGQPRSYLCKSMGLSRCVSDANGARCTN